MSNLVAGAFDCDTHIYEPRDAVTRYLPKKYAEQSIRATKNADGKDVILAGTRVATFNNEDGLGFDYAYLPGSLRQMLREMASGDPTVNYQPEPMRAEYVERGARLRLLDAQGVARCVLFPGGLALSAEHYVDDTDALYANLSSYNRWYDEAWGFNYEDRIYATALLSLRDLDRAVALTDDVIVVALHVMPFWYFDAISPAWGLDDDPQSWRMSAWQWMNIYGERPVIDTISSLIFDNLFGRHPRLRVLIAEHGASWVPHTLQHMDKSRGMGRNGPWIGGQLGERPSAVFKRHVRVAPYPEDDIPRIVRELDGDDGVLVFGSDFPHPEGVVTPADFEALLSSLGDDATRRIMRENAEAIFDSIPIR
jgi:hypothetical protein